MQQQPPPPNSIDHLFLNLHQFQINLLKNTSKQTISEYLNQLKLLVENEKHIDNNANQDINSFIHFLIFPVLSVLKKLQTNEESQKRREWLDLNEQLIECINTVLEKIKLSDSNMFYEILNICSILLSKKMNETTNTDEFYLACLKLIRILFQNSSTNLIESFYQLKNLTSIGLLVSVFLDIINESTSIGVRLNCLDSLKIISSLNSNNNSKLGILFASFLPGISIKIIQRFLLSQNLKLLNHKLICKSLECLSVVICNVFDDSLLDGVYFIRCFDQLMNTNDNKLITDNLKSLIVNRIENKDWLNDSTQKLFMLIKRLLDELIISENLNVHLSMVKFCAQISNKCYFTFNDQLSVLLRVLALFAATTSDLKINKLATEALSQMSSKETELSKQTGQYLIQNKFSIMQTCIEELLLKLPRIMNQDSNNNLDESYRLSHLRQLYGYLKLIGSDNYNKDVYSVDLKEFLHLNMENLNKLLLALISCVTFDYKSLDNFYQLSNEIELKDDPSSMSNYIGLETYLSDKKLFEHLSQICDYLGRSNAARLLIDELLTNIYLQQKHNRCEIMFLINLILHGVSEKNPKTESKNDIYSIINIVLASFINDSQQFESNNIEIESITAADNDNETHFKSSITIERNRKILQTCLVIEAISMSSKCLDRNNFDYFLIDTLYFCLENYLNNNLLIRVAANKCLESLTTNLNYKSIQELLSINYDYIMNDLVLKSHKQIRLKNKENDETTLESHVYVLCSLLDIANVDIVPYLERLVDDYFVSIELNSMDHTIIIGICNIMLHMSRSMRKWYPEVDLKFMNQDNPGEKFLSNLNLKSLVKSKQKPDYYRSFKDTLIEIEESINEFKMKQEETSETSNIESSIDQLVKENEEEMEKIGDEQIEKEQADNKQVQLHIKLQCKCMQLCMHLISHPYKQIRLSIIELIGELSRNLAGHTNEFLPLAHKLWMPICQRFSFDDFIVKSKIIYLLFDLSVYCNDFLASRFCKEFLPRLCKFMQEQSTLSLKSTKDATYIYSHAFKLQCAILSNLDKMCILYDIKEMELENVLTTSIFSYLDKRQPKKLQLLALNSIQNCSLIDPDLVWLCLHYILPFASLNNSIKLVHSKNIKLKSDYQFSNEILEGLIQVYRNLLYSYLKQSE